MKDEIRIVLADDHRMLVEGLKSTIEQEPDLAVVGVAHEGREALEVVKRLEPDVAVLDIGMPGLNGIEATRELTRRFPDTRIVGLSMHADRTYVKSMLSAGARGYVTKKSASEEIIHAIRDVARGRYFVCREVSDTLMEDYLRVLQTAADGQAEELTDRERQVLQQIAEGTSSREIAAAMHISVNTVDTHRRNIMQKLGLGSVAELTKYAIRHGLTDLGD